jgi:hypothetical protein
MARTKKVAAQLDLLALFGGAAPSAAVVAPPQAPHPAMPAEQPAPPAAACDLHKTEDRTPQASAALMLPEQDRAAAPVPVSAAPTFERLRTEHIIDAGELAANRASMRHMLTSGAFDWKRSARQPVSAQGAEALAAKDREVRARHPGWLRELAIVADGVLWGRWEWWMSCALLGRIVEGEIPQIEFHGERGAAGVEATKKMLWWCVDSIAYGNRWSALRFMIDWLAWALGVDKASACPSADGVNPSACALLHERMVLEMVQLFPADYLGEMLCEFAHGQGKGESAFFPTPMDLCSLMAQMTHGSASPEEREAEKMKTAYDCACGTGRTLLVASNHVLRLYGQDIDGLVIRCTGINLFLYAPWGALPLPHLFDDAIPEPVNIALARMMGLVDVILSGERIADDTAADEAIPL